MFSRTVALAALLVATAAGAASAADLPVKAPKAVMAPPFFFVNDNTLSYWYEFTATDPGANLNPRKIVADATKATSGPGTTKKPVAAKPLAAKAAAAKTAPKKAAPRTKARATAS